MSERAHRAVPAVILALVVACTSLPGGSSPAGTIEPVSTSSPPPTPRLTFPPAPRLPSDLDDAATVAAMDRVIDSILEGFDLTDLQSLAPAPDTVTALGTTGDPRVGWFLADVLRFALFGPVSDAAVDAFETLTGTRLQGGIPWVTMSDHLIAWNLPAPPDYVRLKGALYTLAEPGWRPFFESPGDADFRLITWGGVFIDDRPVGARGPCRRGCIPALDDPGITAAAGGEWLDDDRIVFGVVIDGQARAYPKHIMETHEMVNDTLGGRRFALPYCTLCGSAQAFFTDDVDGFDGVTMRTSGLLSRSNKAMFDLSTSSLFDTFRGVAVTGPMYEAGATLTEISVTTTTWGEWRRAHPDTTIVAEDGGIGRRYSLDPLGGRDDNGPIFPIGERDLRLPVQAQVVGVVRDDGIALAFDAGAARRSLEAGRKVTLAGVRLIDDSGGLSAIDQGGDPLVSHQAFWFAWSQFHPDTLLWSG